jgi:hypothetical protein
MFSTSAAHTIHTYNDGSKLTLLTARSLCAIPIWKGNRIIDTEHVENIRRQVGHNIRRLDSGYRIIQYNEVDAEDRLVIQKYIIDGQHRVSVLKDFFAQNLCEEDFPLTATEISVNSEADAIQYFNTINNAKPIQFKEDPNLIVNKYIAKLSETFQQADKKAIQLIRSTRTQRPYLHVDSIRDVFLRRIESLKMIPLDRFQESIRAVNKRLLRLLELQLATGLLKKEQGVAERCIELKFALAFDPKFEWVRDLEAAVSI